MIMTTRYLDVIHVLVPRRTKDTVQFLLSPHARWRGDDGRPLLSLPAKKFHARKDGAGESRHFDEALGAILRDDLDIPEGIPPDRQRMKNVRTHLVSPAHQTPTGYTIAPVLMRVPVIRHASIARRLHGDWLTPHDALAQADLSPTARLVLETYGKEAAQRIIQQPERFLGSPRDREWTQQLILARDGDMLLFASLLEDLKTRLYARLRSCGWTVALTACSADVEDALSEAAVKALEHLHTFDPTKGSALTWLWSITRNCAVSILRKRGRAMSLTAPAAESAAVCIACAALDPAEQAKTQEELDIAHERIARALAAATPRARQIWHMLVVEELSYADIAAKLNMAIGSVATLIHRLRKSIRQGEAPGRGR
jgi:RNA polymerase sigma-70 factor (ECF subfamily)